jgi:hypothetical protein
MGMISRPVIAALTVMVLALLLINMGCSPDGINATSEIKQYQFKRLLLLPVKNAATEHEKGETVLCDLCGAVYSTGVVENGADVFLTDRLKFILEGWTSVILVPEEQYQAARSRFLSSKKGPVSEKEILAAIGRNLDGDAILTGSVYQFRNRVGNNFAIDSPSSVGFHLDLIETQGGHIIWSRRYEETQQALSENLLGLGNFFMRKGKWVTVQDLAVSGLEKILQSLPIQKEKNDKM